MKRTSETIWLNPCSYLFGILILVHPADIKCFIVTLLKKRKLVIEFIAMHYSFTLHSASMLQ